MTVSGEIGVTNSEDSALFDLNMLHTLEVKTYETHTPWSENSYRFKGNTLASLLEAVQAKEGSMLTLHALDGYEVTMTWKEAFEFKPILAHTRNNVAMTRRDRGPLWLIFPRDKYSVVEHVSYDNLWIWQVNRIEVAP